MCSCDVDTCEVYNEASRRARKPHACCECRETIAVGEQYTYVSGVFDRRGFSEHVCGSCTAVLSAWREHVRNTPGTCDPCFAIGSMWDGIREWFANERDRAFEAEQRRAYAVRQNQLVVTGMRS